MEKSRSTYQDRARERVAFPKGQSPIYLIKVTGYCNSLKKQRDVTLVRISTPQGQENAKKPAETLVDK